MKHFISLVLAGVMTAVSVTFSSPTVTAETEICRKQRHRCDKLCYDYLKVHRN